MTYAVFPKRRTSCSSAKMYCKERLGWHGLHYSASYLYTYIHTYIQETMLTKRGYDLKTVKQDQELALQAYIHTYIHTYILSIKYSGKHTYIHTYTDSHVHTYIYTYIQIQIYICLHTYIHACIQTAQASGNRSRELEAALANNATLTQQVDPYVLHCMYVL